MNENDKNADLLAAERGTALWMKIAGAAFALWSVMIPIGVSMLNTSVDSVVAANEKFNLEFKQYVISMERRVTILEERQGAVIQMLQLSQRELERGQNHTPAHTLDRPR
jgi:hypothetical protein